MKKKIYKIKCLIGFIKVEVVQNGKPIIKHAGSKDDGLWSEEITKQMARMEEKKYVEITEKESDDIIDETNSNTNVATLDEIPDETENDDLEKEDEVLVFEEDDLENNTEEVEEPNFYPEQDNQEEEVDGEDYN